MCRDPTAVGQCAEKFLVEKGPPRFLLKRRGPGVPRPNSRSTLKKKKKKFEKGFKPFIVKLKLFYKSNESENAKAESQAIDATRHL